MLVQLRIALISERFSGILVHKDKVSLIPYKVLKSYKKLLEWVICTPSLLQLHEGLTLNFNVNLHACKKS